MRVRLAILGVAFYGVDVADDGAAQSDGRRARRERSRAAVIDAVFALVQDGKVPPSVEQVASRSGVSVSSIFRMFDGLDDMRGQAVEQFEHRFAHLLAADFDEDLPLDQRIDRFVRRRIELSEAAGPLLRVARQRTLDSELVVERVASYRSHLALQTQRCFAAESKHLTPAEAANLIALIDTATTPDAFDLLSATHARTPRQISQTWRRSIAALIEGWSGRPPNPTQGATV